MEKVYRIDYTVPNIGDNRIFSIFTKAENLTLAKHQVSKMEYTGWNILKIEQDTDANYWKWLVWEYEPNKFENARYVN